MPQMEEQETDLGWALGSLLRTYMRLSSEAVGDLPGGPRGYQVLSIVASGGCNNQAAIAESMGLDRTAVTYLVDGLEASGLVTRTPDPQDRRSRRVSFTDAGAARFSELSACMRGAEESLLRGLSPDAATALRDSLGRAAHALGGTPESVCEVADRCEAAGRLAD
ncbi:MarR family winged helix-turn-helix transcriptional regulator [Microbacterium rhizophilus]|uniref:MarR family winged helix-turn-helix transcriptional regulator n=1 Tax=Microbacterium rhizophilus TaxID=3138934 RepID=UPI0031ED3E2C